MGRGNSLLADTALEAGLRRRHPDPGTLRADILAKAAEKKLKRGAEALMFSSEFGKDVDQRLVQIEFEKLADEGLLTRMYQLTCPECGEHLGKRTAQLDPALIGSEQRCKECKHTFVVKALDIYVSYVPSDQITPAEPPARDDRADITLVEKAAKKLLRTQPSFSATQLAKETGVPLDTVRPWLSVMIDAGELDARECIVCRNCGYVILDEPDEVPFAIGHLASCEQCEDPPFVVTAADIYVDYVAERVHRHRRPSFKGDNY